MAILPPWHAGAPTDPYDVKFDTQEFAIGGKLLTARLELSPTETMNFTDAELRRQIKMDMASQLARAMLESNLIEFTHQDDFKTMTKQIYARCYLAPDAQVKILRTVTVK